jgi:hypothetical protein
VLVAQVTDPLRRPVGYAHAQRREATESRPLVPRSQETDRQVAPPRIASAACDVWSGMWRWRGRPRPATGKISATSAG